MRKKLITLFAIIMTAFLFSGCSQDPLISEDIAIENALEELDGFTADDVSSCTLNTQNQNQKKYDVVFNIEDFAYTISIDAVNGQTLKISGETNNAGKVDNNNTISDLGIAEIEKIAIAQVDGAEESDVYYCVYFSEEEGQSSYYVSLFHGEINYDFQIDASTGAILYQEFYDINDESLSQ